MKFWILRKVYEFFYWFGQIEPSSNIQYGYYRKFRKPDDVPDEELDAEIKRLGEAITKAT